MIIMTLRSARNNPLMIEGAGGAEVPKALFYSADMWAGTYILVWLVLIGDL